MTSHDRRPGTPEFRKARTGAPPGFFRREAAGLRWLAAAGGAAVVAVRDVDEGSLTLDRLEPAAPTAAAAAAFGTALARTHDAGAPAFGAAPPDAPGPFFFGPLDDPLTLPGDTASSWGELLADARLLPTVREGVTRGVLGADDLAAAGRVADRLRAGLGGDDEPPARLHGDLWSGNVVWTADGAVLVDPAAHGGHREDDLAMLALFGLPHLDAVLAAYDAAHPLRPGWQGRTSLHQLFPLAVHAVLFGGGYVGRLRSLLGRWSGR
ncbi:fructosamine kinase family protein [Cellulomonas marina]|uniref:Fructosamine-3-kinase n=1 Tax=Cellulomonas marina TaxID=988821 RepID=A0A1I0ZPV5_9CELL|nr:fructosamine kinase family protein [Cellulomonas marina]GIG28838.1 fructosamine kinase [Cellulomonas marina]SFB27829.1 Fructosamine-3-kinase [Cellulomonas marina]